MSFPTRSLAWALLVFLFCLRFSALAQDPLLISPSGMYLTDEGWYNKAAKNLVTLGHADARQDFVPITHTFGFVLLGRIIFDRFGLSLLALRVFNLLFSGAGTFFLCWNVTKRWGHRYAFFLCIALVSNLLLISLTRLALPDTTAFAFLTLAMALLIRTRSPGRDLCCLGLAIAMSFLKTSYLPVTLWFTLVIALGPAFLRKGPPSLQNKWRSALTLSLPLLILGLGYGWIHQSYLEAWAMFSELNLRGRMVQDPLRWFMNLAYAIGADLWSTGSLGLAILGFIHARRLGFRTWLGMRTVQALLLLLGLNFLARSLIWYHPPRYGLVTALAVLCMSLLTLRASIITSPDQTTTLQRQWLGWGLFGQLPLCFALAHNGVSGDSIQRATKSIVKQIRAHPEQPLVLYGSGTASLVSLSWPELKAVDISDSPEEMCARVRHYGDGFLLVDDRKQEQFGLLANLARCGGPVNLTPLTSALVLNNYYRQGPWRLYRLSGPRAPTKQ